jgi:hypothetical protein
MIIKSESKWKGLLTPEDEQKLGAMLESIKKHRAAYLSAEDVKSAQLWCALLEARKEYAVLDVRLKRMELLLSGMITQSHSAENTANKLLKSLEKF